MIVELELPDHLPNSCNTRVHRQIAFKLASMAASISLIRASIVEIPDHEGEPIHQCRMQAVLKDSTVEEVQATGQLNICIADSAARLNRAISRKAQRKEARWKQTARA